MATTQPGTSTFKFTSYLLVIPMTERDGTPHENAHILSLMKQWQAANKIDDKCFTLTCMTNKGTRVTNGVTEPCPCFYVTIHGWHQQVTLERVNAFCVLVMRAFSMTPDDATIYEMGPPRPAWSIPQTDADNRLTAGEDADLHEKPVAKSLH